MRRMPKKSKKKSEKCENWCKGCSGGSGCLWFLGFVGAAVYYIATATGFWMGVWGVIKALVWPAFLVFHLFKFLGL